MSESTQKLRPFSVFLALALRHKRIFFLTIALLIFDALIVTASVVVIAPVADLILDKSQDEWLGITTWIYQAYTMLGIPFSLGTVVVLVAIVMMAQSAGVILVRWILEKARFIVMKGLVEELTDHVLNVRWGYFSRVKRGELFNTFLQEILKVGLAFQATASIIANVLRSAALVLVPLILEPLVVMSFLGIVFLVSIPFILSTRFGYSIGKKNLEAWNRLTVFVKEMLDGVREIILNGAQQRFLDELDDQYRSYADSEVRRISFSFGLQQVFETIVIISLFVVFVIGKSYGVEMSSVTIVLWGMLRAVPYCKYAINQKHVLDTTLPSWQQVEEFGEVARRFRHQGPGGTTVIDTRVPAIELQGVSFSYEGRGRVLENVSLEIPPGSSVAFVGESGSGKSTLADILMGLQTPDEGRVLLDGRELEVYSKDSLCETIGYVSQKPAMFSKSVRDNVILGQTEVSEDRLIEACRIVGLDRVLDDFPADLDNEIGEQGHAMSGGQLQRIAIARTLLKDPGVLILDEATNALDNESEAAVYQAISGAFRDRSIIVVAHRLSTIQNVDRIFVFREGQLVESGSYRELRDSQGYFDSLVRHGDMA